jgi:hypothetical protein
MMSASLLYQAHNIHNLEKNRKEKIYKAEECLIINHYTESKRSCMLSEFSFVLSEIVPAEALISVSAASISV